MFSPHPRFTAICQHQDGGFTRTWDRARVNELSLVDQVFIAVSSLYCPDVLVVGDHGAMMLGDKIVDTARQAIPLCQLEAISDVTDDACCACDRIPVIVRGGAVGE